MGQVLSVLSAFGGMLRFFAHTLLIPLRLSPRSWTSVQLHFSPALPDVAGKGVDANAVAGSEAKERVAANGNGNGAAIKANGSGKGDRFPSEPAVPTLRALLHDKCPSLRPGAHFRPTPYLASGHLQTIYSARVDTVHQEKVHYRRRVLLLPDGGTLSLDITPPELADDDPAGETKTVLVLHGLTGGSGETYVRNVLKPLTVPKAEGGPGYRGIVVNFRACGHTPVTSAQLYSASKTSDFRCAVLFVNSIFPCSPLVGVGFSLGANILAKYMGEEADATPLRAAMVLGAPFDLWRGSQVLEAPGFNQQVYSKTMANNLARVVGKHVDVLTLDKEAEKLIYHLYHQPPKEESLRERGVLPGTLKYFDDAGTRVLGGHRAPYGEFPFATADEYYLGGSALPHMHRVRRPLLAFNAVDDPVVPYATTQGVRALMGMRGVQPPKDGVQLAPVAKGEGNPNLVLATTEQGGHLGWWTGWRPTRWIRAPICEFLTMALEAHELDHLGGSPKHAQNQHGRLAKKTVDIDLLPLDAVRPWDDPVAAAKAAKAAAAPKKNERRGSPAPSASASASATPSDGASGRTSLSGEAVERSLAAGQRDGATADGPGNDHLAWLAAPLLPDAPFVHPFMHAHYTDAAHGKERQRAVRARGRTLQLEFTLDTTRPEVGFAELRQELRVAGAGDTFVGGLDIPGGVRDANAAERHQGLTRGL